MNGPVGFGVLGGRSFVATRAVIPAIEASGDAWLAAVGSRAGSVSYDDVLTDPDVEVVYVPLPNGMHPEWTARAAAAGKHVLCEKPLAVTVDQAVAMAASCAEAGVKLFEAWMTPFSPPWAEAVEHARVGGVDHITTQFTFTIGPGNDDNYRWDPLQGGGALLDVGIYALGPTVELWGSEPDHVTAETELTANGVDLTTRCELRWPDGRTSSSLMSFAMPEAQELRLSGPDLDLHLSGNAHTGVDGTYQRMIDAVCADIRHVAAFPRSINDAVAMLRLIERIRKA